MSAPVKRHPVKAIVGGLLFGLGLALLLINFKVIALGTTVPYVVFVIGVIIGVVVGFFAPPRPKLSHRGTESRSD
jgi:uncharacterized membrane protein YedE/YeeE